MNENFPYNLSTTIFFPTKPLSTLCEAWWWKMELYLKNLKWKKATIEIETN